MSNSKKVYIVQGNQDGNIGVYTNKKLAYECCVDYIKNSGEGTKVYSYSKFCKNLSRGWTDVHNDHTAYCNANATKYWLNV